VLGFSLLWRAMQQLSISLLGRVGCCSAALATLGGNAMFVHRSPLGCCFA